MPHVKRSPTNAEIVSVVAKHARLNLSLERAGVVAPAMDGILELLDSLDGVELGETGPAIAYRAKWED
jgi:Asp-tRNA(Asn)/Glu-tRNA(Gln) amidotransferase C subunit